MVFVIPLESISAQPLNFESGPGFRSAALSRSDGQPRFTLMPPAATGIVFTNQVADHRSVTNRNLLSGSGVAFGDVDGDGWVDLYFCGLDNDNALFRNLGGWRFQDITEAAGVACAGNDSTGATFADFDADGDLDLFVNGLGSGTRLFQNNGKGVFSEVTDAAGLKSKAGSMSLALADTDGDGDLDLYVANFRPTTLKDQPTTTFRVEYVDKRPVITHVEGRPATLPELTNRFILSPSGMVLELGQADMFWRNDGGKFTLVPFTAGAFTDEAGKPLTAPPFDWGLAVQFYDFTGDLAPDIYVCNDLFTPDRIWINDGKGRFRALPELALRHTSTFSMGVDFADIDRDGDFDFFVVDMLSRDHTKRHIQVGEMSPFFSPVGVIDQRLQLPLNTLQVNRGDSTFAEISRFSGVEASEWSWGPIFLDVDLDGWEDIIVSNGQLHDYQNADIAQKVEEARAAKKLTQAEILKLFQTFPSLESEKVLFRNRGDLTFEEVGKQWGFTTAEISQGMALGDLDNDGDLDLVVNNLRSPAGLYRNDCGAPRVAVRLKGLAPNTRGIGAKIKLLGGPVAQSQEMIAGGRYLSSDDPMRVFAAGSGPGPLRLEVTWRSGRQSLLADIKPNHIYEVDEAAAPAAPAARVQPAPAPPFFEDVSELLKHTHVEEFFDDLQRQPLLPMRLSQLGPGLAWHDYDGDGWDDLIIGSGRSGRFSVFQNTNGVLRPLAEPMLQRQVARDQTTVLGIETVLLVGSANYEDGLTNGGWARVYDLGRKAAGENILGPESSTGPMASADVDGDGMLDLFMGGRAVAGKYPQGARSLLLGNEGRRFVVRQAWEKLGLVSGAVFSDLDGDGDADLVLACHWDSVRVFGNEQGVFTERTQELGLAGYKGLWNGVATGDLDGDGRLDIVASNWGLNTRFRASPQRPYRLYHGDLNGDGIVDLVEAVRDELLGKEVPVRTLKMVGMALPFVQEKMRTFEAYGKASVQEIYGEKLQGMEMLEINALASMIFFNRGGKFEGRALPAEAQWSPAFGLCVADLDNDGWEDVFVSQNFFATNPEMPRSDAGLGLWLRGDGKGHLSVVSGLESGIRVYGEQRGCALSDYNGDGKVDLVVSQNGAATRLYRNQGAPAGVRVRLEGPAANPHGIGAWLQVKVGEKFGPVREVQAGSGYWSQNSPVQVFARAGAGAQLRVRWPGGKETLTPIPENALEISIDPDGKINPRK